MDTAELLSHMAKACGKSLRELSRELGRDSSWLSATIHRKSEMRADILAEVARACGYSLVIKGHGEEITVNPNDYVSFSVVHEDDGETLTSVDVYEDGTKVTNKFGKGYAVSTVDYPDGRNVSVHTDRASGRFVRATRAGGVNPDPPPTQPPRESE